MEEKKTDKEKKMEEESKATKKVKDSKTASKNQAAKENKSKKPFFIVGGIVAALAVVYIGFSVFFMSHFYFNSTVNGVDASGQTAETVALDLQNAASDYMLTVTNDGATVCTIAPEDIALKMDTDAATIQGILDEQNGWGWLGHLFSPTEYVSNSVVAYDSDKVKALADAIAYEGNINATTATEDATLAYQNGAMTVVSEVYGNDFDSDQVNATLCNTIEILNSEIALSDLYKQPTILSDDSQLKELVSECNAKIKMNITYTIGNQTEKIPAETIAGWLDCEDGEITYDDDAILEFLSTMAKKYNTAGTSKTLNTTWGTTVTVPAGTYGWKIDKEGELAQLKEDLDAGKDVSRDFVYSQTAAQHGDAATDYGNSYVEINLTAQHLYLYVDGANVFDTDFVSGCVAKNTITHTGAYFVAYKEKDATLKGANYTSFVNYWMPFHNGEGLHDATWRSAFGGVIYKTSGSHGCVNLPLSAAKTIFGYVSAGFPVLVYELPGTEDTSQYKEAAQNVVDMINAIGTVTADSGSAISAARSAYDGLAEEAKEYVTNYDTLTAAEAAYSQVQSTTTTTTTTTPTYNFPWLNQE